MAEIKTWTYGKKVNFNSEGKMTKYNAGDKVTVVLGPHTALHLNNTQQVFVQEGDIVLYHPKPEPIEFFFSLTKDGILTPAYDSLLDLDLHSEQLSQDVMFQYKIQVDRQTGEAKIRKVFTNTASAEVVE